MKENHFVECRNCGTIHYVINKKKAESLKNNSIEGFSSRDLSYCYNCGSNKHFSKISEFYIMHYLDNDKIPPIFLNKKVVK